MAHCAKCGKWMSALVYTCPSCGTKPKTSPPRGLVVCDALPPLRSLEPSEPSQRRRQEPAAGRDDAGEGFAKAPGPARGSDPKRLSKPTVPRPPRSKTPPKAAPRRAAPPASDEGTGEPLRDDPLLGDESV